MTLPVEVVNCQIRHIDVDCACLFYRQLTDEKTPEEGFQIECDVEGYNNCKIQVSYANVFGT